MSGRMAATVTPRAPGRARGVPGLAPWFATDRIAPRGGLESSRLAEMAGFRSPGFRGRASERAVLDRLFANVRGGQSAVLVVRGEAGVGKSELLRYAVRAATGFQVAQTAGVESEMELPFAGLHQLCAPMLDRLDALPEPQRQAL